MSLNTVATRSSRTILWGELSAFSLLLSFFFFSPIGSVAFPAGVSVLLHLFWGGLFFFVAVFCFIVWLRLGTVTVSVGSLRLAMGAHRGFLLVVAGYLFFLLPGLSTAPVWDAGLYYSSLLDGIFSFDFSILSFMSSFSGFHHPTQALFFLYAPLQYLFPGSVLALNLTTLLLGIVMLCSYYGFCLRLFKNNRNLALLSAVVFACLPQTLAFTTGLNPDFGMLVAMAILLGCFAWEHKVGMVLGGVLLLFSKEPGLLLYGGFGLGYLASLMPGLPAKHRTKTFFIRAFQRWYLLIPLILFGLYILGFGMARLESTGGIATLFAGGTRGFLWDWPHIFTILQQLFAFQFQWVFVLVGLLAFLRARKKKNPPVFERFLWLPLLGTMLVYFVFLLFYVEIDLLRYVLPFALLWPVICGWVGSCFDSACPFVFRVSAGCLSGLLLLSSFVLVDPISNLLFPYRVPVGETRLINVTQLPSFHTLCEVNLYNREYLAYSRLLDEIVVAYGSGEDMPYLSVGIPSYSLQFFGNADGNYRLEYSPKQKRRVFYAADSIPLNGEEFPVLAEGFEQTLPRSFRLLVPAFQPETPLEELLNTVQVEGIRRFTVAGCWMDVYLCTAKG